MITTEDVVKVMKACKNAGVEKIKWEKLEIHFIPQLQIASARASLTEKNQEVEQELQNDEDLNDLRMQILMCEDPEAFEDQLRKDSYEESVGS